MSQAMATVLLNGSEVQLPESCTLAGAVATITLMTSGVAVALNGEVAPRSRWDSIALRAGDVVDVVTAKQGG